MGRTYFRPDGSSLMLIDRGSNPIEKQAEMTMIHEMCHQENYLLKADEGVDGHSLAFQSCMVRLADAGAFRDLW